MTMIKAADLTRQAFLRDPAEVIDRLLGDGGIAQVKLPIIGKVWVVARHDLAARILKDSEVFTIRRDGKVVGMQWWMPGIFRVLAANMLTFDEPDHSRLRAIVDEAFRRRAVLEMTPQIRAIADRLADGLFEQGEPADFVARFARQLPLAVICELLGLPDGDRARFSAWAQTLSEVTGIVSFLRMIPALGAMRRYLEQHIEAARASPASGLIGELVRAEREGARISSDEIVAMVFLLLVAGHETTTHLISGALHLLLVEPARRDWLRAEPNRLALAIEEFLRFVSPVNIPSRVSWRTTSSWAA